MSHEQQQAHEPVTVVCAYQYWVDLLQRYAFVFWLPTGQPVRIYSCNPRRYRTGAAYQLTLTPLVHPPEPAAADADAPSPSPSTAVARPADHTHAQPGWFRAG